MDSTFFADKLHAIATYAHANPKYVFGGALAKGAIVGGGIGIYEATKSSSSGTSQNGDTITPPESKTKKFVNAVLEDTGIAAIVGAGVIGAATLYAKHPEYHIGSAAKERPIIVK